MANKFSGGAPKKNAWRTVGEILTSKAGKMYVKFKEDVTLSANSTLMIQDPRISLGEAVSAGRLTEEQAEERMSKIPEFHRYNLVLPPPKD